MRSFQFYFDENDNHLPFKIHRAESRLNKQLPHSQQKATTENQAFMAFTPSFTFLKHNILLFFHVHIGVIYNFFSVIYYLFCFIVITPRLFLQIY